MKATISKRLFPLCALLLSVIAVSLFIPLKSAKAASSAKLAKTYFNSAEVVLHLGQEGKEIFDFDIKGGAKKNIQKLSWYVKEGKGNPKAVSIDAKTGLVTAKNIGTAYIRCKITLSDQTVIRPEAKVIVCNHINSIELTDIPANNTIASGSPIKFNTHILNTASGKDKPVSDIIRFELENDTAGVGQVSQDGTLTPTKPGSFSIRAVCFANQDDYKLWLNDKEANAKYLTAAGDWILIKVISPEATVSTQEELDKVLSSDIVTTITVSAKNLYLTIAANDYSDKTLIVLSPDRGIENHARFKQIMIQSASGAYWREYAVNNSFHFYDCHLSFSVEDKAKTAYINLDSKDMDSVDHTVRNKVYLNIMGVLEELDVIARSDVYLSGLDTNVMVNSKGKQTKVTSSIPLILNIMSETHTSLLTGSEHSLISVFGEAPATIENSSNSQISLRYNGDIITINSMRKCDINESGISIH